MDNVWGRATKKVHMDVRRHYALYLMVVPALIIIFVFNYAPMYGIQIAFRDFRPAKGINGSQWAGLKYFEKFFSSYQFKTVTSNTVVLSLYAIIASFPMPILLAILINQIRAKRYRSVFQTISYMPHFISTVVVTGMVIIFLNPSTGLYGNIIRALGLGKPMDLIGKPQWFTSIYVISDIWQHTGFESVIYLAALSSIDVALYEAATVDGASNLQKILYIDIPGILPTAVVLLILNSGNIMNVSFEKVYMLQNALNLKTSEVISTYIFKMGIIFQQYSLSAAVSLCNNVINVLFLLLVNSVASRTANIGLW